MADFFEENIVYIISVVVLILMLILIFFATDVNFNSNKKKHIRKIVTVEAFEEKKSRTSMDKMIDEWNIDNKMFDLKEYGKKISEMVAAGIEEGGHAAYNQSRSPEEMCKGLTDANCRLQPECVHINSITGDTSCVLGDQDGPFKKSETPDDEFHYFFQNKCYGKLCQE